MRGIIYIMGNAICPASKKDIIQNFTEIEKGDKSYESLFKGCLSVQPEVRQIQRDTAIEIQPHRPGSEHEDREHSDSVLKYGIKMEELNEQHLPQRDHQDDPVVTVADVLLEDGWKYSGPLRRGMPEGQGEEFGPNGDRYVGSFVNGQKNGDGTYCFSNSGIYKGQFKENLMNGYGVFQFPNGDIFEGWFKDNMRDGMGKYTPRQPNIDGMLYFSGQYRKDVKDGPGVIKYESGQMRGIWRNGVYDYSFNCN